MLAALANLVPPRLRELHRTYPACADGSEVPLTMHEFDAACERARIVSAVQVGAAPSGSSSFF
jgi:hypothetical protein